MVLNRNIFSWMERESEGFVALQNCRNKNLAAEILTLIESYQRGEYFCDIRAHRDGAICTSDLVTLIDTASKHCDASNLTLFRGLALDRLPKAGQLFSEHSVSGWTVHPKTAFNIARVQQGKYHVIVREKCKLNEPALYLDEWENEFLRPPFAKTVAAVLHGTVQFYNKPRSLWVVDIG